MSKVELIKRPIEKIGGEVKRTAWTSVIESLAVLVLGILFAVWPDEMKTVVAYVVGAFFMVKGAYQIINYFLVNGRQDFFNNGLLSGVVSVIIGIAVFAIGDEIANVFRVIVGIFLIYESLARINTAMKLQAAGVGVWKYVMILSLVVLVLGVFVTFSDVATVIGWMMILAGIMGIIEDMMFIQHVNLVVDKLTGEKK